MAARPGPGAEPGPLAWSPGAGRAALRPPTGLEVKLGSLVTLLLLTLASGLAPLCFFRHPRSAGGASETRRKVLSLVSCFAGGVFLATCLLDLLPDYLAGIDEALAGLRVSRGGPRLPGCCQPPFSFPSRRWGARGPQRPLSAAQLQFPLQEFILAMGFFLVLVMEQIVLAYKDQAGSLEEETRALLGAAATAAAQDGSIQGPRWPDGPTRPPRAPGPDRPHLHVDFNAHSAVRSFLLVFSLSLHSVFEGLAVGLQEAEAKVLEICLALLIHKCVVAFSLALKLLQGRLRPRAVAACLLLFALMSPLGIGLGVAVTAGAGALQRLWRSVLEGLAAGTFVYITFLEILPHELGAPQHRILKVILLIAGFSLVTAILFIKI
ncbi:zinc transporter ZIP1 isoform X1 [Struthio camelus]|uniref:zinc transporter ZIP1 isoform X1 n=1 Tax=Struthio camelus TaxID=8801 RepID=UPI00360409A3